MCGATGKFVLGTLVVLVYQCAASRFTGVNYHTDDGQYRHEVYDGRGNVNGAYSNIFPSGQMILVKYNAGHRGAHGGLAVGSNPIQYYTPPKTPYHSPNPFHAPNSYHAPNTFHTQNAFQPANYFSTSPRNPFQPNDFSAAANPLGNVELSDTDTRQNEIPTAESVFTPASVPFPAESPEQLEAFQKALEEEAKEAAKEETTPRTSRSYVNFKFGDGKEYNYQL